MAAWVAISTAWAARHSKGSAAVNSTGVGAGRFPPKGLNGYREAFRQATYSWNFASSSAVQVMRPRSTGHLARQ